MADKLMLALYIAGRGMGGVFLVLAALAVCVWLLSESDKRFPSREKQ